MNMKKPVIALVIGLALYGFIQNRSLFLEPDTQQNLSNEAIVSAFQNQQSDILVSGTGVVIRNLPDDTQGSRHQKFILKLASGQTLLIAHNIDLAPRINDLREGDSVDFKGEYEWNSRGGVVHWTHHDPAGRHEDGWLKHKGITYQ